MEGDHQLPACGCLRPQGCQGLGVEVTVTRAEEHDETKAAFGRQWLDRGQRWPFVGRDPAGIVISHGRLNELFRQLVEFRG
jgi:hypothetical protein